MMHYHHHPIPQVNLNNQDEGQEAGFVRLSPTTTVGKKNDDDSSFLVVKSCSADKHETQVNGFGVRKRNNIKGHVRSSCCWTAPVTKLLGALIFVAAGTIAILVVSTTNASPAVQTAPTSSAWWNIKIDSNQCAKQITMLILGTMTRHRKPTTSSSTRNNANRSQSTSLQTIITPNNYNFRHKTSSTNSTLLADNVADPNHDHPTIPPATFPVSSNASTNQDKHHHRSPNKNNNLQNKSSKYRNWHYYPTHVIPSHPLHIPGFDNIIMVDVPNVYQLENYDDDDHRQKWFMSFVGFDGAGYQSFVAQSYDLVHWTNMTLAMGYNPRKGEFDHGGVVLGGYLYTNYHVQHSRTLKLFQGKYWCLYGAYATRGGYEIDPGYQGLASSVDGLVWERAHDQPLLSIYDPTVGSWENASIYQPFLLELVRQQHDEKHYHQRHRNSTNTNTDNHVDENADNHVDENVVKDDSFSSSYFMNIYNAKTLVPQWTEQIGIATSPHLVPPSTKGNTTRNSSSSSPMEDHYQWTRYNHNPVLRVRPSRSGGFSYDSRFAAGPKVFRDSNEIMDSHNNNDDDDDDDKNKWWVNFYVGVDDNWKANIMIAHSQDLYYWDADPLPLYKAGGHPLGLDQDHAHKVSVIWNPQTQIWYMFYCAVGNQGRGIALLTSKPVV